MIFANIYQRIWWKMSKRKMDKSRKNHIFRMNIYFIEENMWGFNNLSSIMIGHIMTVEMQFT